MNIIGRPTVLVIFVSLAFGNYRRLSESWRMWRRNLLWLAGGLVFTAVLTTAITTRHSPKPRTYDLTVTETVTGTGTLVVTGFTMQPAG